jgi:hypothetical protein
LPPDRSKLSGVRENWILTAAGASLDDSPAFVGLNESDAPIRLLP